MDIRNGLDGLKTILGVNEAAAAPAAGARNKAPAAEGALDTDRATFSAAGSEVAMAASGPDVRADKVASVQSALAAGTYNVPATAVASKMVDAMLTGGR